MARRYGIIELPRSIESAVSNAKLAEAVGFDWVGVADTQSIAREVYVVCAMIAAATRTVMVGPCVTNPLTRHPAVAASAIASVNEVAQGRALLGIGSGDSAVLNLGAHPSGLAKLERTVQALRGLLKGRSCEWEGQSIHASWIEESVPVYVSAEGPKTLELAGEFADGVICGLGITPEAAALCFHHLGVGARRAGRRLEDIDVWALARVNVVDDEEAALDEIRMELASMAHHAFRFTQQGKGVPPQFADGIRRIQQGYQPRHHEALGESPNAELMQARQLLGYLASRFAVLGSPQRCAERIEQIHTAGFEQILFTGFVAERPRLIRRLGEEVFSHLR
ncbi:MAG: LLM class flavin-dependent oxidoreductase [Gammaproteobacteria bacterium]|nr:LLM class flavin-dependent oxidoreductase [Gammaproteobacteria bacterium]